MKRNLEARIKNLLELFPAVIILGARQCGKTTLAKKLCPTWHNFDLEKRQDYQRITSDFSFFFSQYPSSIIFDEAQRSPELFQELRNVIDANRNLKGRFLITGSSSPELLQHVSDSLAGRVAIVELGSLKMNELYKKKLPAFYDFFTQPTTKKSIAALLKLKTLFSTTQIKKAFLLGGYPEPRLAKNKDFHAQWMENYFATYVQRDIRNLFPRIDIIKYQRFISMLTSLSGTLINKSEIGRSIDTSEVTIRDYLEIAHGTFIWRNLSSFEPKKSKSIVKMPKGIFRDSGLRHYIQSILTEKQLDIYPLLGSSFESFVIEELIKGLEATMLTNKNYSYYRTKHGAEIDFILQTPNGIFPFEIKYGMEIKQKQLITMQKFIKENQCPLGFVINNAQKVEWLCENILQIPVGII